LLLRLVSEYARNYRTIDMRPIIPTIDDKLVIMMYNHVKIAAPARFKVSYLVRVSKFKPIFKKELHAKLNNGSILNQKAEKSRDISERL